MNEHQQQAAAKALSAWLEDPKHLGKTPFQIRAAGSFELDGLTYYILKFKTALFARWQVGVAGGYAGDDLQHCGHVYSDLAPYLAETAEAQCTDMVRRVRAELIEEAKRVHEEQLKEKLKNKTPHLCFVLLDSDSWDRQSFADNMKNRWDIDCSAAGEGDDLMFHVGDNKCLISLMHTPVPGKEAERNAEKNYLWPEAAETAAQHSAHLTAAVLGPDDLEVGELLVKAVSACCGLSNALCVYTGATVMQPGLYSAYADVMKQSRLPVYNWVWLSLRNDEGRLCCCTEGLRAFGFDEIEVLGSDLTPPQLRVLTENLAESVLTEGAAFCDGDTVSAADGELYCVSYGDGVLLPEHRTCRLRKKQPEADAACETAEDERTDG